MEARHDDRKGSLEKVGEEWLAWKAGVGGGYISKTGGFTTKQRNAARFSGPGEAIATAQQMGFAILSW